MRKSLISLQIIILFLSFVFAQGCEKRERRGSIAAKYGLKVPRFCYDYETKKVFCENTYPSYCTKIGRCNSLVRERWMSFCMPIVSKFCDYTALCVEGNDNACYQLREFYRKLKINKDL